MLGLGCIFALCILKCLDDLLGGESMLLSMSAVSSFDSVPLLPWSSLVFFGVFLGNLLYPRGRRGKLTSRLSQEIAKSSSAVFSARKVGYFVNLLGSRSLLVYLVHQPILVGLFWFVSRLLAAGKSVY